ncbi:hypothetical protein C8250_029095 [Streptomyces sp. So13.3]|uniref:hypothetical protein n=1 Tax=Streptomyces sp. So13.3 TaxID=2136173 RepID=UPI001105EE97|nr:hypothetical protein [Streptomyces sp. So13.3]QNA75407.1 hypothetical protein C8250_029095 [Streptomyces sp. So13.3]
MTDPGDLRQEDLKHLEFLQAVIARHGNNSFLIKGWAITLSGAFLAVASRGAGGRTAVICVGLVTGFWSLDSYYLRQERLFRSLYEKIASRRAAPLPPLTMDAERYGERVTWHRVAFSRTMLCSYGVLAAVDSMMIIFLR